jgi:hypothetical protein
LLVLIEAAHRLVIETVYSVVALLLEFVYRFGLEVQMRGVLILEVGGDV